MSPGTVADVFLKCSCGRSTISVSLQCSLYLLAGLAACEDVAPSGRLFEESLTSLTSAGTMAHSAAFLLPAGAMMRSRLIAGHSRGHLPRHGLPSHCCWWNTHVAISIREFGCGGKSRKAMLLLKQDILNRVWSIQPEVLNRSCSLQARLAQPLLLVEQACGNPDQEIWLCGEELQGHAAAEARNPD